VGGGIGGGGSMMVSAGKRKIRKWDDVGDAGRVGS